jgi:NADPH-dependent curcumin reductase CurA
MPQESDFRVEDSPMPECPEHGMVVKTLWISVDPYLRGRMTGIRTYIDPIPIGGVMESLAVGQVVQSRAAGFIEGDVVTGLWGWQDYAAVMGTRVQFVDERIAPASAYIGILGMPGMTAYFGLLDICEPKSGETLVVSGAAGAVGSAVGQIGKIRGCRVIGTAGSKEKCEYILSLGFDGALNYRIDQPYDEALRRLCPDGIDCYFDNVGGEVTDAVFELLNVGARVSVCGQISQYNDRSKDVGPRPFWTMIAKQVRAQGFLVSRWTGRYPEAQQQMAAWLHEGKLKFHETVYEGLESAPRAFIGLFRGENVGKAVVRV